jgi:hypothetical protein
LPANPFVLLSPTRVRNRSSMTINLDCDGKLLP